MKRPPLINLNAIGAGHKHSRPVNRAQDLDRRAWYRIANAVDGTSADVNIYDEIGYWGTTAAQFVEELNALDVQQLNVHINSPGGDVYDGIAIYNALLQHPADVTTYVDGLAASIGSVIAQAGTVRLMASASQMMIHDASALCVGNAADMRECASMLDGASNMIAQVYAARAGGNAETWRAAMQNETWYSSDEAVAAGLATSTLNRTAPENKFDLSVFNYAGREKAPPPPTVPWDGDMIRDIVRSRVGAYLERTG